ncbi:hypothetical protein MiAbB_01175 [Microcystis aeruginosa NIES-4285]|uniref:Uncharacterized protein n=1 Tax=Microcystis aeruginosa NIES-4285 TaxID=2497681 RepID=A0A402DAN8_MICAE|nr:hypothetical protein MiAbB_01175 [Microcystis aeruginosa NIES-4285]
MGLGVSYQLSVISYQFTEKTPHTPHPTSQLLNEDERIMARTSEYLSNSD